MAVRLLTAIISTLFVLILTFPGPAFALGLAGFDVSRPEQKNPDGAFKFNLNPGESIEDRVVIKNTTTDTVQRLRVYSADAMAAEGGGIGLAEFGDERKGLAKWIEVDAPDELVIGPGESQNVWFRLSVPNTSSSTERLAGILVERTEAIKDAPGKQFSFNRVPRVAILVSQRLPGPALTKLDIVEFGRKNRIWSNPVLFGLTLKNTGNVLLRPSGTVDIYNMFGGKQDKVTLQRLSAIFPGRTSETEFVWKNTPFLGYFTAKVNVEYGEGQTEQRQMGMLVLPWWLIFVAFALILIARRARTSRAAKELADKEQAERETHAAFDSLSATLDEIESEAMIPAGLIREPGARTRTQTTTAPTATVATPPKRRGRPPKARTMEITPAAGRETVSEEAPPRRRGRPPKTKTAEVAPAAAPETVSEEASPRRRGRPPKAKTAEVAPAAAKPVTDAPKRRGRPPKVKTAPEAAPTAAPEMVSEAAPPRRRGRPPKTKTAEVAPAAAKPVTDAPKRRGRPPKAKAAPETAPPAAPETVSEEAPKRRRGRPPKKKD